MRERAMSDLNQVRAEKEKKARGDVFRFLLTVDRRSAPSGFASTPFPG